MNYPCEDLIQGAAEDGAQAMMPQALMKENSSEISIGPDRIRKQIDGPIVIDALRRSVCPSRSHVTIVVTNCCRHAWIINACGHNDGRCSLPLGCDG